MKQIYFIHIPKTAGMAVKWALRDLDNFYPAHKDREHKFGVSNASRGESFNPQREHWLSYSDVPSFIDADITFSVIRNPFDLMVSYYCHDAHGTGKESGWGNVNDVFGFKSFDEFITYFCSCDPKDWHVPMLNLSLISQIFDKEGNSNVDYLIRFENLQEGVDLICKKMGVPKQKLIVKNKSEARFRKDYRSYYSKRTKAMLEEKLEWDLKTLEYSFDHSPTDIISSKDIRFYYKGETL